MVEQGEVEDYEDVDLCAQPELLMKNCNSQGQTTATESDEESTSICTIICIYAVRSNYMRVGKKKPGGNCKKNFQFG